MRNLKTGLMLLRLIKIVIDSYSNSTWSDGSLVSENAQARIVLYKLIYL